VAYSIIFCTALHVPKPAGVVAFLTQNRYPVSVSDTLPKYLDLWSEDWEQFTIHADSSDAILLRCITQGDGTFDESVRQWMNITNQGCFMLFSAWRLQTLNHLWRTRFIIEIESAGEKNPAIPVLLTQYFEQRCGGISASEHGWSARNHSKTLD
jgi:hypothetical protein